MRGGVGDRERNVVVLAARDTERDAPAKGGSGPTELVGRDLADGVWCEFGGRGHTGRDAPAMGGSGTTELVRRDLAKPMRESAVPVRRDVAAVADGVRRELTEAVCGSEATAHRDVMEMADDMRELLGLSHGANESSARANHDAPDGAREAVGNCTVIRLGGGAIARRYCGRGIEAVMDDTGIDWSAVINSKQVIVSQFGISAALAHPNI